MTTFKRVEEYLVECPSGDGGKIKKDGFHGGDQRYECKSCGRKFRRPDHYAEGRRFPIQQVGLALQAYFDGLSYRETARNIGRTFGDDPDKSNIYRWVQGYSRGINEATKDLKVSTSDTWVADEILLKTGGKRLWLWNIMDRDSRYLLATHLTPRRNARAAEIVFKKALQVAKRPPTTVLTDGLPSYIKPIQKVLGPRTRHIRVQSLDSPVNNNLSERLQGTIRDRDKVLRAMKTRESGQNYLDGWAADYNFFRPHLGLKGHTPAAVAGARIPYRNWNDVAEQIEPMLEPVRPAWHFIDEEVPKSKDFQTVPLDVAREATRPTWEKVGKFKTRMF